ncbi:hypothetical protein [Streptomyces solaniscabiei]|nr:hypothetical protein [Streptomyces solaniscabiei]
MTGMERDQRGAGNSSVRDLGLPVVLVLRRENATFLGPIMGDMAV